MPDDAEEKIANLHPIQLESLNVKELYIRANVPPNVKTGVEETAFTLRVASSEYDEERKQVVVGVKAEVRRDEEAEEKPPFTLKVELAGRFRVDEERFPMEEINHWARQNAPLVLIPYLREHVFALTARCGFKPMMLPLLEVPTFKFSNKENAGSEENA